MEPIAPGVISTSLVRFDDGASLYDLVELRDDLEVLLGIPVDVVSERGLRDSAAELSASAVAL